MSFWFKNSIIGRHRSIRLRGGHRVHVRVRGAGQGRGLRRRQDGGAHRAARGRGVQPRTTGTGL